METGNEELHSAKEKRFVDEGQKIFKWIPTMAVVVFLVIAVIQMKSCSEERAKNPPPPPPAATAPAASTETYSLKPGEVTPWIRPKKGFRRDGKTAGGVVGICYPSDQCQKDYGEKSYVKLDPGEPIQFESLESDKTVTVQITFTPE